MRCQTVKTQDMGPTSDRLHVILAFHQLTLFKPFKTSDRSCRFIKIDRKKTTYLTVDFTKQNKKPVDSEFRIDC